MKNRNIKETWKELADENIQLYGQSELERLVIKGSRKALRGLYPTLLFLVIYILVVACLFGKIGGIRENTPLVIFHSATIAFVTVFVAIWYYASRKMKRYTPGLSVKEWLDWRIRELEKSIRLEKKYALLFLIAAFLAGAGTYLGNIWLVKSLVAWNVHVLAVAVMVLSILLLQGWRGRRMERSLTELQELRKRLEE